MVELTLPEDANIYASKYQLYLPSKQELAEQLAIVRREVGGVRERDDSSQSLAGVPLTRSCRGAGVVRLFPARTGQAGSRRDRDVEANQVPVGIDIHVHAVRHFPGLHTGLLAELDVETVGLGVVVELLGGPLLIRSVRRGN